MQELSAPHRAQQTPTAPAWPATFPLDIALGLHSEAELLAAYQIDPEAYARWRVNPVFIGQLREASLSLAESGGRFRAKAKAQAEELLKTSWLMIHDPLIEPRIKADLIKSTVQWAGFDKPQDQVTAHAGAGISISINLGSNQVSVTAGASQTPLDVTDATLVDPLDGAPTFSLSLDAPVFDPAPDVEDVLELPTFDPQSTPVDNSFAPLEPVADEPPDPRVDPLGALLAARRVAMADLSYASWESPNAGPPTDLTSALTAGFD